MVDADAENLTEPQAREIGRALSGIAVSLDDAIDDEERRLFPTIRKALSGISSHLKSTGNRDQPMAPKRNTFRAKTGAPCGIRTHGPRIRNPVLYPSELRGRA
jgi:hypothetical protein